MKTRMQKLRDLYRDPAFDRNIAPVMFSTLVWGVWGLRTQSPGLSLLAAMGYLYVFVPLTSVAVERANGLIDERARRRPPAPPDDNGPPAS